VRGSEGFVSVWLYTFPESIARSKLLSLGSGWMARGEEITVDLPRPFFFSKNEKLVVGFLDRCLVPQNLSLPRRRGSDISQIGHFHDLMDREAYVQFDGVKDVVVAGFNRIATAKRCRKFRHEHGIVSVKGESGLGVARIKRLFVGSNNVNDILVHRFLGLVIGYVLFVGQNSIGCPRRLNANSGSTGFSERVR